MIRALAGRAWVLPACAGLWLIAVASGLGILLKYSANPGNAGDPPIHLPSNSPIRPPAGHPVLVMMVHPRCACTRASLEELARLTARNLGRFEARVVVFAPAAADERWWSTDLWASAAAIPGVDVVLDREANEARRFGTETSGHALLYDGEGRLMFSGGLTVARGHAGDNEGLGAVEALIRGEKTPHRRTPVYGCALHDFEAAASSGGGA